MPHFHPNGTVTLECLFALASSDSDVLRAIAAEVLEWRERDIRIRAQVMTRGIRAESVEMVVETLLRTYDQAELLQKVLDGQVKVKCREQLEEMMKLIEMGWKV